jgi:hypothetical protein
LGDLLVSLHKQVQKEQVTAVSLEGSHILSFTVVTGVHQLTVQLIDQRASLESIDRFLGLPMGLRCEGLSMAVFLGMLLQRQSLLALCLYFLSDVFPQLLSATSMHP